MYGNVHLANLPSFFSGINAPPPTSNRTGKQDLLRLVKRMTLYNPRVTLPSSSRRQPSPTVFTIDPVYPYPDRKTIRLVDETLESFAALANVLAQWDGPKLLPQLTEFTSTSLNTDKWEPIERFIKAGGKDEKRHADFKSTSTIVDSLIRQADDEVVRERHWKFWPVSGPYTNAIQALAELSPSHTCATQYIDQYPSTLPPVARNTIVIVRPLIAEASFGRYLNWPELRSRLHRATRDLETPMQIEIGCRLVPSSRRLKDWGRIDSEINWEMDKVEEINATLEQGENASWKTTTKLVWMQDALLPEAGGEERRGR